jgi:hypothetical protein
MIMASTDQLEQRLQQAKRSTEVTREEEFLAQESRKQEEHARSMSSIEWKESKNGLLKLGWRFRRSHPNFPKIAMQESRSIKLSFSKENDHNWPFTLSIWKCSYRKHSKKERSNLESCRRRWRR